MKPLIDYNEANNHYTMMFCQNNIELVLFFNEYRFNELASDIKQFIEGVKSDEL